MNNSHLKIPAGKGRISVWFTLLSRWLVSTCFAGLLVTQASGQQIIYVRRGAANSGSTAGSSWQSAYGELRDALRDRRVLTASAASPVEVWIAAGTYVPTAGTDRTARFSVTNNVALRGGFAGTENSPSQRPANGVATILSGDIGTPQRAANQVTSASVTNLDSLVFDQADPGFTDNSYNVIYLSGVTNVVLDSLVIANGNANNTNGSHAPIYATAMVQSMVTPSDTLGLAIQTLDSVTSGGGVFLDMQINSGTPRLPLLPANQSSLLITKCLFVNNYAAGYGGAICSHGANLSTLNCRFQGNVSGQEGGAICSMNTLSTVSQTAFDGNRSGSGGAVSFVSVPTSATLNVNTPPDVVALVKATAPLDSLIAKFFYNAFVKDGLSLGEALRESAASQNVYGLNTGYFQDTLSDITVDDDLSFLADLGSLGEFYNGVSLAVGVTSFGVQLAVFLGTSPNNTFVKGWNTFSQGFNTYANPVTWAINLLVDIFQGLGVNIYPPSPTVEEQMDAIKRARLSAYNFGPYSKIEDCTFNANRAIAFGGALGMAYDNVLVNRCTFQHNHAYGSGGALFACTWNTPRIANSAFVENSSSRGHSAIFNYGHTRTEMIDCTFVENSSTDTVQGCAIGNDLGAETKVFNCVLWSNSNRGLPQGGADIFTATLNTLDGATRDAAQGVNQIDYVAICDIRNSDIQSLGTMPRGYDDFDLFHIVHSLFGGHDPSQSTRSEIAGGFFNWDDHGGFAELLNPDPKADLNYQWVNVGQGNRPAAFTSSEPYGYNSQWNFSLDPRFIGALPIVPDSQHSPVYNTVSSDYLKYLGLDNRDLFKVSYRNGIGAVAYTGSNQQGLPTHYYVNASVTGGDGSGRDWPNACHSLANLIAVLRDLPNDNLTIWVAAGNYSPAGTLQNSFSLYHGLKLYGGFAGNETSLSQRNWRAHPTVLNGGNSSLSVVTAQDGCLVDGFTITGGNGGQTGVGGGVYGTFSFTLQNCNIVGNRASSFGGGVYAAGLSGTHALVQNCLFASNSAAPPYGGVMCGGGMASTENCTVLNCVFYQNNQGGLSARGDRTEVYNCTFYGNTANSGGGIIGGAGVYADTATLIVRNSILWGNTMVGGASVEWNQLAFFPWAPNATGPGLSFSIDHNVIQGLAALADLNQQPYDNRNIYSPTYPALPVLNSTSTGADPRLISPASGNFQLAAGSSGIGLADASLGTAGSTDFQGNPRLVNGRLDAGAVEFQQAVSVVHTIAAANCYSGRVGFTFSVALGTNIAPAAYSWQVDRNDGSGFVTVQDDGNTTGSTSPMLSVNSATAAMNGWIYRAVGGGAGAFYATPTALGIQPVRYVNAASGTTGPGLSWDTAFQYVEDAVASLNGTCGQIWVAQGTYYGRINFYSGLAIYGGFAGNETGLSQRNPTLHATAFRDFVVNSGSGVDSSAILDGITFFNDKGYPGPVMGNYDGANPTIRNCVFTGLDGYFGPAAVLNQGASPHFISCVFSNNSATSGAVEDISSSALFESCVFYNNRTRGNGAAVYSANSQDRMINCDFIANYAGGTGAAIFRSGGSLSILNSILALNTSSSGAAAATQIDGSGGGFVISNSFVQFLADSSNGNLIFDPLLRSPATGDFTLSSNSPAIDAGNSSFLTATTDFTGAPRINGGSVDIGAYEFSGNRAGPIQISSFPQWVTLCVTAPSASFTVAGASTNTYQWQLNTGGGFIPVNGGNYSISASGGSSTLTVSNLAVAMNNYQFRAVVGGFATPAAVLQVTPLGIVYVKSSASGANNGTSWNNAYTDVTIALRAAGACSEIWVAAGNYSTTGGGVSFAATAPVYGGFAGTETTRAQRNWTNHPTRLQVDPQFLCPLLDGFYVTGSMYLVPGFFGQFANCVFGGGQPALQMVFANATISNCVFTGNVRALQLQGSSPTILDSIFSTNGSTGQYQGPAIDCEQGSNPTIDRCQFVGNTAYDGGAILVNAGCSPVLANTLFYNNLAERNGGALYHLGNTLKLVNCTFYQNSAAQGPAVCSAGTNLLLLNSIAWNNASDPLIAVLSGTASISNSCVQGLAPAFLGASNLACNPLFLNPAAGNFSLSPHSPGVNAGNNAFATGEALDLPHNPRLAGAVVDMGAYESTATAGSPLVVQATLNSPAICVGSAAGFAVNFSPSNAQPVVRWQSNDGSGWVNLVANATNLIANSTGGSMLILTNVPLAFNGLQFRWTVPAAGYTAPASVLSVKLPHVIYVDAAAAGGNGSSWATAFKNLPTAIAAADGCAQIWVARGTYQASSQPLELRPGLSIYGGFAGNENSIAQRDLSKNTSNLASSIGGVAMANRGVYGFIDPTVVVDGFSFSGYVTGISNYHASPTIQNCVLNIGGTAVYNVGASPNLINCRIYGHTYSPSVVNAAGSSVALSNCLFLEAYGGGALQNLASSTTVVQCSFTNNVNTGNGGAIQSLAGALLVDHCFFGGNYSGGEGGAIYNYQGNLSVSNSVFVFNRSQDSGAAIASVQGTSSLSFCTVAANLLYGATYNQGHAGRSAGFYQEDGTSSVNNSIFWGGTEYHSFYYPSVDSLEQIQIVRIANQPGGTLAVTNSLIQGLSSFAGNLGSLPSFVYPPPVTIAVSGPYSTSGAGITTADAGAPRQLSVYPAPAVVCPGSLASFTLGWSTNQAYQFNWQVNAGSGFADVTSGGIYSVTQSTNGGIVTFSLGIFPFDASMTNWQVRFRDPGLSYIFPSVGMTQAAGQTYFVNATAVGQNNGLTWADAFTNLDSALAVTTCGQIWVAQGTYVPANGSFEPPSAVAIYGGFAGSETNLSQRDWLNHPTMLASAGGTSAVIIDGSIQPVSQATMLDGFFFAGSTASAVILATNASPTIRNCTFNGNSGYSVYNAGAPILTPIFLTGCYFSSNQSSAFFNAGNAQVSGCAFSNNLSTITGSAIVNGSNAVCQVDTTTFAGNAAVSGGAILDQGSQMVLSRCQFINNSATGSGGAILTSGDPNVLVWNSLFVANVTGANGGALDNEGSVVFFENCTVANNTAGKNGAGIYNNGAFGMVNGIVWGNRNSGNPPLTPGYLVATNPYQLFEIPNPTIAQAQLADVSGTASVSFSDVEGFSSAGLGVIDSDPMFLLPGDFHVSTFSPTLARGQNYQGRYDHTTSLDLDGNLRFPTGKGLDLGAYEFESVGTISINLSRLPISTTNCPGDTVQFVVSTLSPASFTYTWLRITNGAAVNLAGASFCTISSNNQGSTITLPNLSTSLGGNYELAISNGNTLVYLAPFSLRVNPSVLFVNAANPTPGDGSTWAKAFTSLEAALQGAGTCPQQIWLAMGTYHPVATIPANVSIYGGFAGNETALSQRDWVQHPVVLQGNGSLPLLSNNSQAINNVLLDGLLIQGGSAPAQVSLAYSTGPVQFQNCQFQGNANNVVQLEGSNSVAFVNCGFQGNTGGSCVSATYGSTLNFSNCVFRLNSGGSCITAGDAVALIDCTFYTNACLGSGGALGLSGASATAVRCVFAGNSAGDGGAVAAYGQSFSARNCVFAYNHAIHGGTISGAAAVILLNCDVVGNSSLQGSGGVQLYSGVCSATNSLFWDNTSGSGLSSALAQVSSLQNLAYCCVQGLQNPVNGNVAFLPLFQNSTAEDFRLTANSALLNAGQVAVVSAGELDLDHNARLRSGQVDIGAYEFTGTAGAAALVTQLPLSQDICIGGLASFALATGPGLGSQVQWLVNSGAGFVPVTTNDSAWIVSSDSLSTLYITNTPLTANGTQFKANVGGYSIPAVTLSVTPPGIVYVNAAAHGLNTGLDWSNAFTNLAFALTASSCSEVWVAQGTYIAPNGAFRISSSLPIYGGFAGNETTRSGRNWNLHRVTLLASGSNNIVEFVSPASGPIITGKSVLDGFTLTGRLGANYAILNQGASPVIQNCMFTNLAGIGLVTNYASSPLFANCTFNGNTGPGAAVSGLNSFPTLLGCAFLTNSLGALRNYNGGITMSNCVFTGNVANPGGLIYNGAPPSAYTSFNVGSSTASINACTFSGNSGGVINNGFGCICGITNCLFSGNSSFGNGVIFNDGNLALVNDTLADNVSASGASCIVPDYGSCLIINSILWGNSFPTIYVNPNANSGNTGTVTTNHSCIQGLSALVNGNLGFDPLFVGPGTYQLQPCSPAINAGDSSVVKAAVDLEGNIRTLNGAPDLGAFEYQLTISPPLEVTQNPASFTYCALGANVFSVASTYASATYLWQADFNDGSGFIPLPQNAVFLSTATASLTISNPPFSLNGSRYRCLINVPAGCSVLSTPATLSVKGPVIFVSASAPPNGDGLSWGTALNTLNAALSSPWLDACSGQIWVAGGSYPISSGNAPSLLDHVAIYGGFSGTEAALGQRNWAANPTILDGGGSTIVDNETAITTARLDGFVLQNGSLANNNGASPVYANCVFSNTTVSSVSSAPLFASCRFVSCTSAILALNGGSVVVTNCLFSGDSQCLEIQNSVALIQDSVFNSCSNSVSGAIFGGGSQVTISQCQFTANEFPVLLNFCTNLISQCSFKGNSSFSADCIQINNGVANIDQCVFQGNNTKFGAVGLFQTAATVQNSLFSGNFNTNFNSAGLTASSCNPTLINCTFSGNYVAQPPSSSSIGYGAGALNGLGTIYAFNCIFWNNGWGTNQSLNSQVYGQLQLQNCCVQGRLDSGVGSSFSLNNSAGLASDPIFTQPLTPYAAPIVGGDYHLQSCSPAANAGINAPVIGLADLDGNARLYPTNGVVDLGCYESQSASTQPLTITAQPASLVYCGSANNQFQVTASGTGLVYQWQVDQNDGTGFVNLAETAAFTGTTTGTLTVVDANSALNGTRFRCLVTSDAGCQVTSATAVLTVNTGVFYVNATAPAGGNGLSWATAFNNLAQARLAVPASSCSTEIWVAAGTYTNPNSRGLNPGESIYGGFSGVETSVSQRNWTNNQTIILPSAGVQYTIYNYGSVGKATLDGLVFTQAPIAVENYLDANVTFANCTFIGNTRAIDSYQCSLTFNNCRFIQNTLGINAGSGTSSLNLQVINGCYFASNSSAVHVSAGVATVVNCSFVQNGAPGNNYALLGQNCPLLMTNVSFIGNIATSIAFGGGASQNLVLNSCYFAGNTQTSVEIPYIQSFTAINCVFSGNTRGCVDATYVPVNLYNCTIVGNTGLPYMYSPLSLGVFNSVIYNNQGSPQPTITSQANNWFTGQGDPGFLSVADPSQAPTTQGDYHLKPNSPLRDAGNNAYVVSSTDLSGQPRLFGGGIVDIGAYEFQVYQLAITAQPVSQTLSQSGSGSLTVTAGGTAPFQYQWERNGTYLSGATKSVLNFAPVQLNNAGVYQVIVSNPGGSITSAPAVVNISAQITTNLAGTNVVLTWPSGYVLQSAPTTNGPYADVMNAVSPWLVQQNGTVYQLRPGTFALTTAASAGTGTFAFDSVGIPGYNYALQTSTNLRDWTTLQTNVFPIHFVDTNSASSPALKFYRVQVVR